MSWLEFSASKCDKSLSFNKAWTDCVFFNRQINKEIAVCIHRGVLFIHKEGRDHIICRKMDRVGDDQVG